MEHSPGHAARSLTKVTLALATATRKRHLMREEEANCILSKVGFCWGKRGFWRRSGLPLARGCGKGRDFNFTFNKKK